jgi:hypothetical protein
MNSQRNFKRQFKYEFERELPTNSDRWNQVKAIKLFNEVLVRHG